MRPPTRASSDDPCDPICPFRPGNCSASRWWRDLRNNRQFHLLLPMCRTAWGWSYQTTRGRSIHFPCYLWRRDQASAGGEELGASHGRRADTVRCTPRILYEGIFVSGIVGAQTANRTMTRISVSNSHLASVVCAQTILRERGARFCGPISVCKTGIFVPKTVNWHSKR